MKLVTYAEMLAIEKAADAAGHSYGVMMEHAGGNLAEVILEEYPGFERDGVLGLVGKGNNGGDTLVALSVLAGLGWRVTAYLAAARREDPLVRRLEESGARVLDGAADNDFQILLQALDSHAIVLDGILGTGLRLPVRGHLAGVLAAVRDYLSVSDQPPAVIAVDCPSGVDCDTGEAAPQAFPADLTVTMAAPKVGLFAFPAFDLVGELKVVGIGLPRDLPAWNQVNRFVMDEDIANNLLPVRPLNAHKGTFGTALVVAGSQAYTGAVLLAGRGAYRVGAGLVTLAVPSGLHTVLAGHFPEATWLLLPEDGGAIAASAAWLVKTAAQKATALLLGPGFGLGAGTAEFLAALLEPGQPPHPLPPLVVDADGLKLLAAIPNWPSLLPGPAVLTPHPGEMAALTGLTRDEIQLNRVAVAEKFSREWGHVVVLKGAFTVIASPDGCSALIPVATPALARAGSGDVLAGIIAGLCAQNIQGFGAAVLGAWLHAQAGLAAEEALGGSAAVLAGDLLEGLITVLAS